MRDIYVVTNEKEREVVIACQRTLGVPMTGEMDTPTRMKVRGVQALFKLPLSGILDQKTLDKINEMRNQHG